MEVTVDSLKDEVSHFRDGFKKEELGNAEKSIFLEREDNIGFIVFDAYQEKANKLSTPNLLRFFELLLEVEKDKSLSSLIIISKKPRIFIAGADIAEIQQISEGKVTGESLTKLQNVFTFLENLPIPSIAAIHGACLGGGLELTLACDYRVVTDAKETKLGLPEVQLGVLPGWGGTQRLPRLVGLAKGLDLILTGRQLSGKSAKRMGLADKLVPKELLREKAIEFSKSIGRKKRKANAQKQSLQEKLLESVPGGKWLVLDQARKMVLEKTKGNYPAPLKILSVIKDTFGLPLEEGLKKEVQAFTELVVSPESKNLIRVYYLRESVRKDKGVENKVAARPVGRAGILGAGVMGGGIAQLFAAKGVRVRMKDINWDAVSLGYQSAYKVFSKLVKKRKLKPFEVTNAMALIEGTTAYSGFKNLDLVVEAVVEDLAIKKKVFEQLDQECGPATILATNTSSLSVTSMAQVCKDPSRVVGMHFFNPVHMMPLVEVIRGKESSDEAVATVFNFAKKLGKTPIVVKDAPGFVVNRILGPYLNEAVYLMLEGVSPVEIDAVMERFGMPMGPCTLLDEVGLDVSSKVSKILFGAFGERMKAPAMMENISDGGRLGKKSGKGIYLYEEGKKSGVDTKFLSSFKIAKRPSILTEEVVERRLTFQMVNEASRIIEEGLVRSVSDIDVGMIFGTGFAPFRGGLIRFADTIGAEAIVGDLEIYTRNYGPRFQPSEYLQKLAVDKKPFYQ